MVRLAAVQTVFSMNGCQRVDLMNIRGPATDGRISSGGSTTLLAREHGPALTDGNKTEGESDYDTR
jgi:hypothetical protein